jgi:hypothetical protein
MLFRLVGASLPGERFSAETGGIAHALEAPRILHEGGELPGELRPVPMG